MYHFSAGYYQIYDRAHQLTFGHVCMGWNTALAWNENNKVYAPSYFQWF